MQAKVTHFAQKNSCGHERLKDSLHSGPFKILSTYSLINNPFPDNSIRCMSWNARQIYEIAGPLGFKFCFNWEMCNFSTRWIWISKKILPLGI